MRGLNKWDLSYRTLPQSYSTVRSEEKKRPCALVASASRHWLGPRTWEIPARRFSWATDQGANQSRKTGVFPFHIDYQTQNTFLSGAQSAGDPSWLWPVVRRQGGRIPEASWSPTKTNLTRFAFRPLRGLPSAVTYVMLHPILSHVHTQTGRLARYDTIAWRRTPLVILNYFVFIPVLYRLLQQDPSLP